MTWRAYLPSTQLQLSTASHPVQGGEGHELPRPFQHLNTSGCLRIAAQAHVVTRNQRWDARSSIGRRTKAVCPLRGRSPRRSAAASEAEAASAPPPVPPMPRGSAARPPPRRPASSARQYVSVPPPPIYESEN